MMHQTSTNRSKCSACKFWIACLLLRATNTVSLQDTLKNTLRDSYLEVPVGAAQVRQDDWELFLRDNLESDVAPWRSHAPLAANDTLRLHSTLLERAFLPSVIKLILIYNNRIYYPDRTDVNGTEPPEPCDPHMLAFHRKLSAYLASGRRALPDVLFVLNVDDNRARFCSPAAACPAPLLSLIKTLGREGGDDTDILVPQMLWTPNSLYMFPWHLKKDRAFFRGSPYCSGVWYGTTPYRCFDACPRTYLALLSARDAEAGNASVLDVGLTEPHARATAPNGSPLPNRCITRDLPVLPRAPIAEHTYHKWLLHLEGITASSRLAQLFMTNSVVLMQRSPFIEYFYRSLRPMVHFVPFWNESGAGMDDVYGRLAWLRAREAEDPAWVQGVVRQGNSFAMRFTTPAARFQYLREALSRYKALFPDMDSFLEGYVSGLRARGFAIPPRR